MPRVAKNSLYQLSSQILLLAVGLFTSPYIVHTLGLNLYGILVLVGITTNYFGVVEMGLGQATIKFLVDSSSREDWPEFSRVFWTSSLSYLFLGVVGAVGMVACTPLLLFLLKIPAEARAATSQAFIVSAVALIVSLQVGLASSVARALERFEWVSRIGVTIGVAQALLTVVLLYLGYSLVGVMIGSTALQVLALGSYALLVRVLVPDLERHTWDPKTFRRLAGFGGYVSISQLIGPLLVHVEKFILSSLIAVSVVTYYTVPYNVINALSFFPASIAVVTFPAFTRLHSEGNGESARELYIRGTKIVFGSVVPIAVVIGVFARQILTLWMGKEFGDNSAAVMQVLAVALVISAVASLPYQLLQAIHRPDLTAKFHILELVLHIPLCFYLISAFGLIGAAVAWALRVALDFALLARTTTGHMGIGLSELFRSSFQGTIVGALCGAPILILARLVINDVGRIMSAFIIAITGIMYFAGIIGMTLDRRDRNYLTPLFARWGGSAAP
jgi:O-antigen/teichoic acid export membrane protein